MIKVKLDDRYFAPPAAWRKAATKRFGHAAPTGEIDRMVACARPGWFHYGRYWAGAVPPHYLITEFYAHYDEIGQ